MCPPRMFPIAPDFKPICFAQNPPLLTYTPRCSLQWVLAQANNCDEPSWGEKFIQPMGSAIMFSGCLDFYFYYQSEKNEIFFLWRRCWNGKGITVHCSVFYSLFFVLFNFVMLVRWGSSISTFSQIWWYWRYGTRKSLSTISYHRQSIFGKLK
jgi:hypothetical protein